MSVTIVQFMRQHLPRLQQVADARILRQLIAFRLQSNEANLLAHPELLLEISMVTRLEQDVAQLVAGRPLAFVYGFLPFLDWDFACDERALMPRPETEALMARCLVLLASRKEPLLLLDLCCGCGVMGLSLALAFPAALAHLTDLCPKALSLCKENAAEHNLTERVLLFQGDLWAAPPSQSRYNLIVANPPYVASDDVVAQSVLDYEPHDALFSADAGMAHIKKILVQLPQRLLPGGLAAFELGHLHHQKLLPTLKRLETHGNFHFEEDPFGVPRFLFYIDNRTA